LAHKGPRHRALQSPFPRATVHPHNAGSRRSMAGSQGSMAGSQALAGRPEGCACDPARRRLVKGGHTNRCRSRIQGPGPGQEAKAVCRPRGTPAELPLLGRPCRGHPQPKGTPHPMLRKTFLPAAHAPTCARASRSAPDASRFFAAPDRPRIPTSTTLIPTVGAPDSTPHWGEHHRCGCGDDSGSARRKCNASPETGSGAEAGTHPAVAPRGLRG
jgi:hypothetical protein